MLRPITSADLVDIRPWLPNYIRLALPQAHRDLITNDDIAIVLDNVYGRLTPNTMFGNIMSNKGSPIALSIAIPGVNEFDNSRKGIVHTFYIDEQLGQARSRKITAEMLSLLEQAARQRGTKSLDLRLPYELNNLSETILSFGGWQVVSVNVRKKLEDVPLDKLLRPPIKIRPANSSDTNFLLQMFQKALWAGLLSHEKEQISEEQTMNRAKKMLLEMIGPQMTIMIAEHENERIGHASANNFVPIEFSGQREAVLYDAYVLEAYRQMVITKTLVRWVELVCYKHDRQFINGTVSSGGSFPAIKNILTHLTPDNWHPMTTILRKPLHD